MHSKLLLFAGIALLTSSHGMAGEEISAPIARIESITVRTMESAPEQLHVQARGMASTGGWTKPELRKKSQKEGLYVFEFVAQRPLGIVTQALTRMEASVTFPKPPDLREVQVVSATNSKSEKIK
ncbi:MAG: hypothetical protein V4710_10570 [Verrucomicrobiota bacterium]